MLFSLIPQTAGLSPWGAAAAAGTILSAWCSRSGKRSSTTQGEIDQLTSPMLQVPLSNLQGNYHQPSSLEP